MSLSAAELQRAEPFVKAVQGLRVAQIWRGHGSAMFIELGDLTLHGPRRLPRRPYLRGQATLGIEWSWRIENPRSILCGSWTDEVRWTRAWDALVGASVSSVDFSGRLPEIDLGLDNGMHVVSAMTAEGQPEWALGVHQPTLGYLCVKRGRLSVELPSLPCGPLGVLAPSGDLHG